MFTAWIITLINQHNFFRSSPCRSVLTLFLLASHRERLQNSPFVPADNVTVNEQTFCGNSSADNSVYIWKLRSRLNESKKEIVSTPTKVNAFCCCLIINA